MIFAALDIETAGDQDLYALQPWRAIEGSGRITLSAAYCQGKRKVMTKEHSALVQDLRSLGRPVALWNGMFDLAWLHASSIDISGVKWIDAMHLWKFLDNGQDMPMSWTLKAAARKFLKGWAQLQAFLDLKEEHMPDPSDPYWLARVSMDAEATALIAAEIWPQLTPQQQRLAIIQAQTLPVFAKSWVSGIRLDLASVKEAAPGIIDNMKEVENSLSLREPGVGYVPSKVLASSVKLGKLLYEQWGLPCETLTDKGKPATHKSALTYLADIDDKVLEVLRWKSLNTVRSKFTNSPIEACEYLNSEIVHPDPKIFGTYTGRVTYGSKTGKKKTGIAIHQMPREKSIRSYIKAFPEKYIFEFDAKGQEVRLMACASGDERLIELFNSPPPYDDPHSFVGAAIMGISFDEFLKRKAQKDPEIVGPHGYRMLGKVTTLSIQYRTGIKTLRRVARVQYGITATIDEVVKWVSTYMSLFPGVQRYWISKPKEASACGYTETFAGRRYKLTKWKDMEWGTSSSAINFPIQGTGADQKELAIAVLAHRYPEYRDHFGWDLHDGLFAGVSMNAPLSLLQGMNKTLDDIDYEACWGVKFPVPFTWEGSFGPDWGHKKGFEYSDDGSMTLEKFYNL